MADVLFDLLLAETIAGVVCSAFTGRLRRHGGGFTPTPLRANGNHSATPPHSRGAKTPGRCMVGSRLDNEGAGKAGRSPHPQPRVRKKAHERSHHRFAEITRPSLRNGFNGCFVLSPANRAFLPPSPAKVAFRELDTSVGVSGPHAFSVRIKCLRQKHFPRPSHPAPR